MTHIVLSRSRIWRFVGLTDEERCEEVSKVRLTPRQIRFRRAGTREPDAFTSMGMSLSEAKLIRSTLRDIWILVLKQVISALLVKFPCFLFQRVNQLGFRGARLLSRTSYFRALWSNRFWQCVGCSNVLDGFRSIRKSYFQRILYVTAMSKPSDLEYFVCSI